MYNPYHYQLIDTSWDHAIAMSDETGEVHDYEGKCKEQAYTRLTILRMEVENNQPRIECKKIFHNIGENP